LEDDVFTSLNGRRISSREDFEEFVRQHSGAPFKLIMLRDGRRRTIISPGRQGLPDEETSERTEPAEAIAEPVSALGNREVEELGLTLDGRYEEAAVVQRVAPNSPAARAGVRAGDHVMHLDGQPVRSNEHLVELYRDSDPQRVDLTLSRRVRRSARVTLDRQSR
jgi:S1-C subfamily serine protease